MCFVLTIAFEMQIIMKQNNTLAQRLLKKHVLTPVDAARLLLEAEEELGPLAYGVDRPDMLRLMRRVIRRGIAVIQAEEKTVSFEEAAWASVGARNSRREATKADLRYFVKRMLRVEGIAARPLRSMTTGECRKLLEEAFGSSVHSYRKGRAILHSIFAYGYRREWCDTNPVSRIEMPTAEEKEIIPLSPKEIRRLKITAAQPFFSDLQLPLHLMLYCGVRPAEVARIDPQHDINWAERTVRIRPLASKTGGGRVVPLRGISSDAVQRFKTTRTLKYSSSLWRRFRRHAGFRRWIPDVLRHTFATYHAVHFRNLPALQLEMGHRDITMLQSRYINAGYVSRKMAGKFWQET